jgi:Peptidase family M28
MLNGRLYRAAFVPFLFALALAAFSLSPRPLPLTSTLAPDAFEGQVAFAELQGLGAHYPDRRPGSAGDAALANHIAAELKGLGGTAGGGFSVRTEAAQGQTIGGEVALENVIAERPGSTSAAPILIIAHRDAAAGPSSAELSGTAALLELARVFAARETKRTVILASTSGGSGGDAGASALLSELHGPFDAAVVLGDLAGVATHPPVVVPFSDGLGSAPIQLQRTLADAITHQVGSSPGAPSTLGQLAHLVYPLAPGEQGVLNEAGVPSVLVQASGERGPSPREAIDAERLQSYGRAVLSAVDALDTAPGVAPEMQTSVLLQHQTVPEWALRLLTITLLLPALVAVTDGLARARRRRRPIGQPALWALSCSLPFLCCATFAYLLGRLGVLGAVPAVPVLGSAMPFDGTAVTAVVAVALTFALAWLLWSVLIRRLGWGGRPDPDVAGLALLLVLLLVALVVWAGDPFTVLLALPAVHLWLLLASPELRPPRLASLGLVALALAPLGLLIAFYSHQLGLGAGGVAWSALLLVAGGQAGFGGAILWSLALGCGAAALILALRPPLPDIGPESSDGVEVTIRGPLSYAGPGSLGGTRSALRR